MDLPFPVEIPYVMRPNMRPLADYEPITFRDNLYENYIEQKKKLCSLIFGNCVTERIYQKALNYLRCKDFTEATHTYQEDFVVWAPNADNELSIQIASVCFPSGWRPEEKINLSFAAIHEPVADNELIQKAAPSIASMITTKGPFVRHVWTLANSSDLNQHPSVKKPWTNENIHEMYYRVERQVTVPLQNMAIFFIRTYVVPYINLSAEQQWNVKESILSMSDAVAEYKGLKYVRKVFETETIE